MNLYVNSEKWGNKGVEQVAYPCFLLGKETIMEYKVNNISYKYTTDGPQVLKNVSFSIEQGKVTAIVGPSGCGKSTLVQIFSQVIPKLIGNGELEGSFDVPEGTFVSVVSQNPENQLFGYGVEDAIAFGQENIGMPQAEIVERMEYVLDL